MRERAEGTVFKYVNVLHLIGMVHLLRLLRILAVCFKVSPHYISSCHVFTLHWVFKLFRMSVRKKYQFSTLEIRVCWMSPRAVSKTGLRSDVKREPSARAEQLHGESLVTEKSRISAHAWLLWSKSVGLDGAYIVHCTRFCAARLFCLPFDFTCSTARTILLPVQVSRFKSHSLNFPVVCKPTFILEFPYLYSFRYQCLACFAWGAGKRICFIILHF